MPRLSVLITRPLGGTTDIALAVEHLGYRAVIDPLLEIVPLPFSLPATPFDALLITSTTALRFVPDDFSRHTPVLTIGEATRTAAIAAGFETVRCIGQTVHEGISVLTDLNSPLLHGRSREAYGVAISRTGEGVPQRESLPQPTPSPDFLSLSAKEIASPMRERGINLLYLSGQHITQEIPTLPHLTVTRVPVYDTRRLALEKNTIDLLYGRQIRWIVLFSRRTAEALAMAVETLERQDWITGTGVVCLSVRTAEPVSHLPWRDYLIAAEPTAAALIAALS